MEIVFEWSFRSSTENGSFLPDLAALTAIHYFRLQTEHASDRNVNKSACMERSFVVGVEIRVWRIVVNFKTCQVYTAFQTEPDLG
jgi:hypothetical protein